MAEFELSKWYADCVTRDGDALIVYSAELRWSGPAIHYACLLEKRAGKPVRGRYSVRAQPPLEARDGGFGWVARSWRARGEWRGDAAGIREILYSSPEGSIEWNCLAPRAEAVFRIGSEELRGTGYVEHLRLTIPPWRLPIRELRWGRFIGESEWLVWIDWPGPHAHRLVYRNGALSPARSIDEREIVLEDGGGALAFESSEALREGALGSAALAAIPGVNLLFPANLLRVRERKWLSRARFTRPDGAADSGMAIHEVIEWP